MYVTVRFGDCRSELFNPNCRIISLLKNIRDRCSCFEAEEVDLSDENGNVKYLRETPYKFASEILTERENLVLLRVDKNESYVSYSPLLMDNDAITEEFLARLAIKDEDDGSIDIKRMKPTKKNSSEKINKSDREKSVNKLRMTKSITSIVRSKSRQGKTT
ncbi:hypothetical protein SNE40_022654 [Patella caerulea]|uniref:Uncharacterized protein n=1 Tax=Patella caerulea TaxID=87958 RepID=A0AAN8IZT5_PATCE